MPAQLPKAGNWRSRNVLDVAAVAFPATAVKFRGPGKPGNPRMTSQEDIPVPGFLYLASAGPRKPLPDRLISFPEEPTSRLFAA